MRRLIFPVLFLALVACKGPPARLVAGVADTVVVNNQRAVQLPMRVLALSVSGVVRALRATPELGRRPDRESPAVASYSLVHCAG